MILAIGRLIGDGEGGIFKVLKRIKALFWLPYFIFSGKIEKIVYKCGHYHYDHMFGNKEERVKKLEHFKNHDCYLCNPKWPRC